MLNTNCPVSSYPCGGHTFDQLGSDHLNEVYRKFSSCNWIPSNITDKQVSQFINLLQEHEHGISQLPFQFDRTCTNDTPSNGESNGWVLVKHVDTGPENLNDSEKSKNGSEDTILESLENNFIILKDETKESAEYDKVRDSTSLKDLNSTTIYDIISPDVTVTLTSKNECQLQRSDSLLVSDNLEQPDGGNSKSDVNSGLNIQVDKERISSIYKLDDGNICDPGIVSNLVNVEQLIDSATLQNKVENFMSTQVLDTNASKENQTIAGRENQSDEINTDENIGSTDIKKETETTLTSGIVAMIRSSTNNIKPNHSITELDNKKEIHDNLRLTSPISTARDSDAKEQDNNGIKIGQEHKNALINSSTQDMTPPLQLNGLDARKKCIQNGDSNFIPNELEMQKEIPENATSASQLSLKAAILPKVSIKGNVQSWLSDVVKKHEHEHEGSLSEEELPEDNNLSPNCSIKGSIPSMADVSVYNANIFVNSI